MTTIRGKIAAAGCAVVGGMLLATAQPITHVRWPGHACIWDPVDRDHGQINVSSISIGNQDYVSRLELYCPLPFMRGTSSEGAGWGIGADVLTRPPDVFVYDGSSHPTDGKVRSQIYQFEAAASGNWSACSNVYSDGPGTGFTKLSPPFCSSVLNIVTLMVDLPKVDADWYSGSALRFYTLDNPIP